MIVLYCIVLYSDLEHFCGFYALQNKLLLIIIKRYQILQGKEDSKKPNKKQQQKLHFALIMFSNVNGHHKSSDLGLCPLCMLYNNV